jgi:hypothetical protein
MGLQNLVGISLEQITPGEWNVSQNGFFNTLLRKSASANLAFLLVRWSSAIQPGMSLAGVSYSPAMRRHSFSSAALNQIPCWRIRAIEVRNVSPAPCCFAWMRMPSEPVTVSPCSRAIRRPTVSSIATVGMPSDVASATTAASPGSSVNCSGGGREMLLERLSNQDAARNSSRANCVRPPASIS